MTTIRRIRHFLSGHRVDAATSPPYLLHIRSSKAFILSTICVAVFTDIFLYGIIVPVIPFALSARAGVAESDVQKYVSVLLAVYGAALLVGSPLAGCNNLLVEGLAAAIVWTVGTALLVDTVGQKEIGQVLGYVSLSMSVGILLAPLLGGIVYDKAGYYSVYYMAFALIVVDIFFRLALIEKKLARQWGVEEVVSGVLDAAEQAGQEKSQEPASDESGTGESRKVNLIEPSTEELDTTAKSKWPPVFTLLASRRLLTALWGCIIQGSLMTAFDSVIPLFVQRVFNWNSVGAGLVFLAVMVPSFIAPLIGWLSDTYGPRWLTVGGFIFAIPFWVLLRLVTQNTIGQKVLLCALLALIGVGLTLVLPPLMAEITYVVEAKERERPGRFGSTGAYAQAYGLFIAAFAAGSLIGPIWSGYVLDSAGWGTMAYEVY
ncbi:hypothetical protein G7Y89_g11285 [Cudoniella acicularis]|uniref:Major facilitator superfamily (MFS) profile domain-containing protein n=1 Tax=Cudoniella acicularis TaxID=354080 RepID=A0A8H4RB49_9HELO|nr:hypothetical protein G7Y89_g11285 [Cudoniella acicularis]